jgi:hypothetical protein
MPLPSVKKISTKVALSYVLIAILQGGLSILTLNFVTTQAMEASLDDQRLKTGRLIESYFVDAKNEMSITADLLAGQGQLASLLSGGEEATLGYELAFYLAPLKLDAILVLDQPRAQDSRRREVPDLENPPQAQSGRNPRQRAPRSPSRERGTGYRSGASTRWP